jgi:cytochrome P450
LFQEARDHGDVVRVQFGPFHVCILNSPDVIRQALVGEARKLGKGLSFGRPRRLIGNGLVMSEGESHDRQRRLMQPAFHRTQVARYVSTMRDVAVPRISGWPDGGTLAFDREMRSITLTVLTRTLLSSDIGADVIDEIERLLRVLLSELVTRGITANVPGLAWVPTRSNRRFGAASRRLDVLLAGIIDGYRRAEADPSGLISLLMRARDDDTGAGMTDKQLRDEATTLVIADSETTGNTIAWACCLLPAACWPGTRTCKSGSRRKPTSCWTAPTPTTRPWAGCLSPGP